MPWWRHCKCIHKEAPFILVKFKLKCKSLQASKPVGEDLANGADDGGNLASAIGLRVKQALAPGQSEPLRCSACRTAGSTLSVKQFSALQRCGCGFTAVIRAQCPPSNSSQCVIQEWPVLANKWYQLESPMPSLWHCGNIIT